MNANNWGKEIATEWTSPGSPIAPFTRSLKKMEKIRITITGPDIEKSLIVEGNVPKEIHDRLMRGL